MGKTSNPSLQKYGVPFYSAAFVPYKQIRSRIDSQNEDADSATSPLTDDYYAVLAGGGGEGRSGIPNAAVVVHYDSASRSLSAQPVAKLETGSDVPYRMAVHPGGDGLICALPKGCRFFEWDLVKENSACTLGLRESEKELTKLEDIGQQLALAFNGDGSILAVGGEDGKVRVLKWPSLETIFNEAEAHSSVKDLCFSPDGKFLVSLGVRDPGRVWDLTSAATVASLSRENDEVFAACRFSLSSGGTQVFYVASITDKGANIVTWDPSSWKRMSSKRVSRDSVTSFNVSPDGKVLAVGTIEGDVVLISSSNTQVQSVIKKAHIGMVVTLDFSHDSRALVSASMDSSARVTLVQHNKTGASSLWITLLIILLAIIAAYSGQKHFFYAVYDIFYAIMVEDQSMLLQFGF